MGAKPFAAVEHLAGFELSGTRCCEERCERAVVSRTRCPKSSYFFFPRASHRRRMVVAFAGAHVPQVLGLAAYHCYDTRRLDYWYCTQVLHPRWGTKVVRQLCAKKVRNTDRSADASGMELRSGIARAARIQHNFVDKCTGAWNTPKLVRQQILTP